MDIVITAFNHAKNNHGATDATMWRITLTGGLKYAGTLTALVNGNHMVTSKEGRNTYFQASQVVTLEVM
jgi:hypothetical protein